ncbi:FecCD family ABC transporter permease [Timonella sp. A28]|uniref:FecCD family ABC transporter permease n=1 Tax=Timonella sp. A28 TaxID=3442640 RepID=UPI003EC0FE75
MKIWSCVGVLLLLIGLSIFIGSQPLTAGEVWQSLTGGGPATNDAVVWGLRIPRTLIAVVCGCALGLAGALTQEHTRNVLADPGLLGVTAGASGGVVVAIMLFGFTTASEYVWCALIGALIAAILVLGISAKVTAFVPATTVILTGAIVSALLGSLTSMAVLIDKNVSEVFRFWSVGSLASRNFDVLLHILPLLLIGLTLWAINLPAIGPLSLGDINAQSLGRNVRKDHFIGFAAIACLTAAATAACGSIAFLGLLAPHLARALTGPHRAQTAILSGICGAALMLAADITGRIVLPHSEVPVGIMLALIGAPTFIMIARKKVNE